MVSEVNGYILSVTKAAIECKILNKPFEIIQNSTYLVNRSYVIAFKNILISRRAFMCGAVSINPIICM